jgi:hypothetical protein
VYVTRAAPVATEQRTNLSDKKLTGIVTELGRHIAIFAVKDVKPLILADRESISGWQIHRIAPLGVSARTATRPCGAGRPEPRSPPRIGAGIDPRRAAA